jgi:hypothetical protein
MPKGEKVLAQSKKDRTKAKGPHHHLILKTNDFQIGKFQTGILLCSKRGESSIFKIDILKPSWTLRGGFQNGGVLFSQRKSIWNRGRKFQILKMPLKILFIYPLTILQNTLKRICKRVCKNKQLVQAWSKTLNIKECIHANLMKW